MGELVKEILTHKDFIAELAANKEKLVVVDFFADWCPPCRMIAPTVERWASEYGDQVAFFKINIGENSQTAEICQIKSMPTFQLFRAGELVEQVYGAKKDTIKDAIERHK